MTLEYSVNAYNYFKAQIVRVNVEEIEIFCSTHFQTPPAARSVCHDPNLREGKSDCEILPILLFSKAQTTPCNNMAHQFPPLKNDLLLRAARGKSTAD